MRSRVVRGVLATAVGVAVALGSMVGCGPGYRSSYYHRAPVVIHHHVVEHHYYDHHR